MIYQSIRTLEEFRANVQFGQALETIHLDFKQTFSVSKADDTAFDLAVDLAAFANTQGGVLLFGISEAKNSNQIRVAKGVVPGLDAEKLKQFLNNAVVDRIQPAVRFESFLISLPDGAVMAVNVEPSIEVVGVCLNRDRQAFSFPYRTEHGNRYMDFAQVEERMSESNSRRTYLKLQKLLKVDGSPKEVVIFPGVEGDVHENHWWVELLRNNDQSFILRRNSNEVHMPFSLIEEAWRMDNMETGKIAIRLRYRLSTRGNGAIDFFDSVFSEENRKTSQAMARFMSGGRIGDF